MRRLIEFYRLHNLFYIFVIIFFLGCDGDIHSKIKNISYETSQIKKLELSASDPVTKKMLKEILQKRGFILEPSEYKLFAEHRNYKNSRNNGVIKSTSNTSYDGLVLIELFHNKDKIYSAFMDYRGEFKDALFEKLLSHMIEDIQLSSP